VGDLRLSSNEFLSHEKNDNEFDYNAHSNISSFHRLENNLLKID